MMLTKKIRLILNPFGNRTLVHEVTFSWLGVSALLLTLVLKDFGKAELDTLTVDWISVRFIEMATHLYALMIFPVAFHVGCWLFSDRAKFATMLRIFSVSLLPYLFNLILALSLLLLVNIGWINTGSYVALFWMNLVTRLWFLLLVMILLSITYQLTIGQFLLSLVTALVVVVFISFLEHRYTWVMPSLIN